MPLRPYTLREIKHARTKIALMNYFIGRLRHARLEDLSVKAACRSVEISQGTFFNYFPKKLDVITYYVTLMIMKLIWQARRRAAGGQGIALLNAFFAEMAEEIGRLDITYELMSIMLLQRDKPKTTVITAVEKHLFFPACTGIERLTPQTIDEFFRSSLAAARQLGELPKETRLDQTLISLLSILAGTLIATKFSQRDDLQAHYRRQLRLLWNGLGAQTIQRNKP